MADRRIVEAPDAIGRGEPAEARQIAVGLAMAPSNAARELLVTELANSMRSQVSADVAVIRRLQLTEWRFIFAGAKRAAATRLAVVGHGLLVA